MNPKFEQIYLEQWMKSEKETVKDRENAICLGDDDDEA